jgi:hypothetical protein
LHLAGRVVDPTQRDAAFVGERDELVEAEWVSELAIEIREREVNVETLRVIAEQATDGREIVRLSAALITGLRRGDRGVDLLLVRSHQTAAGTRASCR